MEDAIKKDIISRLNQIGHNGLNISEGRWKQLESVRTAAIIMNERRKEALAKAKGNELTVANVERTLVSLKEEGMDITTVTDQTMRNNDGLLERFMLTFTEKDGSYAEARKKIQRLSEQLAEKNEELDLMYRRDAECEDATIKLKNAEKQIENLKQDLMDAESRLAKYEKGKASTVVMGQVDLTKKGGKKPN